jgi:hypothetical protein
MINQDEENYHNFNANASNVNTSVNISGSRLNSTLLTYLSMWSSSINKLDLGMAEPNLDTSAAPETQVK